MQRPTTLYIFVAQVTELESSLAIEGKKRKKAFNSVSDMNNQVEEDQKILW